MNRPSRCRVDLAQRVSAVADRLEMLNERFGSELQAPARATKRP